MSNLKKHGVSFAEAASVFCDPLSLTFPDPDHSEDEERFITIGMSEAGRVLLFAHADRAGAIRIISARKANRAERNYYEENGNDDVRPEYDLSAMKTGVKGKYAGEYAKGTNLVLLEKDVADFFPDSKSVNDALRSLVRIARAKAKRAA